MSTSFWDGGPAPEKPKRSALKIIAGTDAPEGWIPAEEPPTTPDDPGYMAAVEADTATSDDPVVAAVRELNASYMVVNEAGRAVIYAPAQDQVLKRKYFDRISFEDFRRLYLNRTVTVGMNKDGTPAKKAKAEIWLRHPERRQYIRGVIFDPSGTSAAEGTLNLWEGFAVQPKPGSWGLLNDHIKSVICGGDDERFQYLMQWLARMVQKPAERGEVAVVMRGGEGTGKGTVARAMARILGQHALAISNSKHLTGNFNSHLRDCVFLFADEAFFAGDKQHVGVLKSIITEPFLTVEGKYQNAIQAPNFLHLMMASNEEWVVPASLGARRFFVLEVGDDHKDDHAYFEAIWQEMDAGGYEAMLADMQAMDLTHFNVRRVPDTEGLQKQKKLSLGTEEAWWMDVLHRGFVFKSRLGLHDEFGHWEAEVSTELLYASYLEFAREKRERHTLSRESFGRLMVRLGAENKRLNRRPIGEHITEVATTFGDIRKAVPIIHTRPTGYRLGDIDECRRLFCAATGLDIDWPDDREAPR
jgi:hypothetical protein